MERLQQLSPATSLIASEVQGIPADWVEACAFAWLARAHHNGITGNIPEVTGATKPCVLGTAHTPGNWPKDEPEANPKEQMIVHSGGRIQQLEFTYSINCYNLRTPLDMNLLEKPRP